MTWHTTHDIATDRDGKPRCKGCGAGAFMLIHEQPCPYKTDEIKAQVAGFGRRLPKVTYNGQSLTMAQWARTEMCKRAGLSRRTIRDRLKQRAANPGLWPIERVLTEPVGFKGMGRKPEQQERVSARRKAS